jgi:hypothetical protein
VQTWGTPLIQQCARVIAITWIVCQVIMGLAQLAVVAANISIKKDLLAAIMMCYVMQLLPLLWAFVFTFVYPARVRRRWGYKHGVRDTCYPPPANLPTSHTAAVAAADGFGASSDNAAAAAGKDADVIASNVGGSDISDISSPRGCGWGGGRWHQLKRSGSSMLWLLGAAGSGSGRSSGSSSTGQPEDIRMVVGGDR